MSHLLLVFTAARRGEAIVATAEEAFAAQAADCEVTLLFVLDAGRGEHLQDCLSGRGFVGSGPTREVERASSEHAHAAAETRLAEVRGTLEAKGFSCKTEVVTGPLFESVSRAAEACKPDRVYMTRSKLGPLARLFGERDRKRFSRHFGEALILREETGSDVR